MGTIELDKAGRQLLIHSNLLLYGSLATEALALQCSEEVETLWNEPQAAIQLGGEPYRVVFIIRGYLFAQIKPQDIFENRNPKNNYFRVEEKVRGNISFVDGINSNTGYLKLENLYKGSTTMAHEYGHTLGLDHPINMDIRGGGMPGIMYPRGTLVDPQYQYDPTVPAGPGNGGTLHPMYRKVLRQDIDNLQLESYNYSRSGTLIIGGYSAIYHEAHTTNEW